MSKSDKPAPDRDAAAQRPASSAPAQPARPAQSGEIGGPAWPEPTRYGDWERGGRVSDF